jgi:pantoate kinase
MSSSSSQITFFCPGHISGYFRPFITDNPLNSGSSGAGVVIDSGVTTSLTRSDKISITILRQISDDKTILISEDSPAIRYLLNTFNIHARVITRCQLPLSAGFGLSAAALLGTVHAINMINKLGMTPEECAICAHRVEIIHQSGLGDISACQGGGWTIRKDPGPNAQIKRFYSDEPIHALTLSPIKTSSILSDPIIMKKIYAAFPDNNPVDPYEIMKNSRQFAESSGLISHEVRKVLTACDANDIPASMTMLGCGVFAIGQRAESILSRFGNVYTLHPAKTGPCILENK